jgi:hypothetical protein
MASIAPSRFHVVLDIDPTSQELVERQVYWSETSWTPMSAHSLYVVGDKTVLSNDGKITFLDCHVIPGCNHVYPFGEWTVDRIGELTITSVNVEEHSRNGTQSRTVDISLDSGCYVFPVTPGTERVCLSPM